LSNGENYSSSHSDSQTHIFCGIVREYDSNTNRIKISLRNRFEAGDELEIISPNETIPFKVTEIQSTKGKIKSVAHGGGEDVWINSPILSSSEIEYALVRKPLKQEVPK
jgi:putative protease